jgi:vancomycin resistance protein VanJ
MKSQHAPLHRTYLRSRWLALLCTGYVVVLGVWLSLRLVAGDRLWWLALLNTDALLLFFPLVILLPLAWWRKRTRLLLLLALPVAAFVWLFGERLLPPPASPEPTGPSVTAMTFNVLWSNQDYGRIAEAIRASDADLVALQELRPEHLPALNAALAPDYPHSYTLGVELYHTIGLLSRLPIEEVTPLSDPPFERALLARLRVEGRPLAVVVAHLTPTNMLDKGLARLPTTVTERYTRRGQQAEALLEFARTRAEPLVVLCDCNLTDTSEAYTHLRADLRDSFAEAGWGPGYTMLVPVLDLPAQRLDYIWHTPELVAVDARVGPRGGSDHLPVVARLAWP